jgi:hypothetical protein
MIKALVLSDVNSLPRVAGGWERLRKEQPRFFPDFDALVDFLSHPPRDFRLIARFDGDEPTCIACFVASEKRKGYNLGERKLFSLRVREVSLFGSAVLGAIDAATYEHILEIVRKNFSLDLISLGEVPLDAPLFRIARQRHKGFLLTSPSRKHSVRWLIHLPGTFDAYLAQLSAKQRQTVKRKMRKLEGEQGFELGVISRADQVAQFLTDGERISRLTYQWDVGDRLCSDAETQALYARRAARGHLRCYIVYLNGSPCAFLRGELMDGVFHYETPGYDPQFSKLSPGLVLLMWALKDLIENADCKVFDFGTGGDTVGYKSMFGNFSITCADLEVAPWSRPYSILLVALQEGLTLIKNAAACLIGEGELKRRMKKLIRKHATD